MSRFSKSKKNEAFFFEIGPLRLPPYWRDKYAGRSFANGFRESRLLLLKLKDACPRYLSVPGLVRISMRPRPKRSYSAEKGFWLMRISRMEDFGGNRPFENPSIKI